MNDLLLVKFNKNPEVPIIESATPKPPKTPPLPPKK